MQILFWITFFSFSKEDSEILGFYDMLSEMKSNPILFSVSILFIDFLRYKTFETKIPETIIKTPISNKINHAFIKESMNSLKTNVTFMTLNEIELVCFMKYFKPSENVLWLFCFRRRIIYVVYCELKNITNKYFINVNIQRLFKEHMHLYTSEYYSEEIETAKAIIKSIEEHEKTIISKELKNIVKPDCSEILVTSELQSQETANPDKNICRPIFHEGLFLNTNSKLNIKDKTQNLAENDQNQQNPFRTKNINQELDKFVNNIYKDAKISLPVRVFYSNMLKLFDSIFQKYYASSFDKKMYEEYFHTDNLNAYGQILEDCDKKTAETIFDDFYKICFTYFEDHLKKFLSNLRTVSLSNLKNIDCFLEEFVRNLNFFDTIICGPSYLLFSSENIQSMCYDQRILVFDIDDTLFPTSLFEKHFNDYKYFFNYDESDVPLENFMIENIRKGKNYSRSKCEKIVKKIFRNEEYSSLFSIASHLKFKDEFRRKLQSLSFKKICFTNAADIHAKYVLKQMNLLDCFDHVLHRDAILEASTVRKPQERAYDFVEKFLGTSPSNIYFYDDLAENINMAKERGWNAFLVENSLVSVLDDSLKEEK